MLQSVRARATPWVLAAQALAVVVPGPGTLGRLRLPRTTTGHLPTSARSTGPVLLFLPARNEERTVARVVRRVPDQVLGHRVECVVVDDGSDDRTARVAASAGATVVSFGGHQGLGAAVRCGLAHAHERGAVAVAFCDADEEYAPEEIERVVGPILEGRADYVVGSRFAGETRRMQPLRIAGNVALTRLLSFVARRRITDGQSGFRALSASAAAAAEIIHDFNYAQVLTLDLLGKGFRYEEAPISYRRRVVGRSFVRLAPYLRAVVPAVYRELNSTSRG
jgi:glycosyltransferase involved in cell wall biosynthesis